MKPHRTHSMDQITDAGGLLAGYSKAARWLMADDGGSGGGGGGDYAGGLNHSIHKFSKYNNTGFYNCILYGCEI